MNLINKKLLLQKISTFEFPNSEKFANAKRLLEGWHKALKDSDLEKTKEKSVQGKFLSTFFEAILGYSDLTTGQEEWTLIQHPRIENDNKEPDGSLGWFSKDIKTTKVVIELKDAKTQLDKKQNRGSEKLTPIEQAYLYATKYEGCNWIIVSNFKEIRLYNKHRTQEYYERFDVVDLIEEAEFKRFYYLLSKETLISKEKESIIDVLAKNTTEAEQDITKKFYAEYKQIRLGLLDHLGETNPNIEKIILLEKAQKLLDRFIFTLFCEDSNTLLPLNIVKNTYERALNSLSPSDERVWTELRGLFIAIDKGNTRVIPPINAYNGGLFASDDILDKLSIKDEYWAELMKLADYDFETDLNVNILGHIFEQSISDLESIKESIILLTEKGESITTEDGNRMILEQENTKVIEKTGRRKKDGIFYTPEYITKYLVENSVGKFLEEHPESLENIKILDPACGSGSILNQAHSFLQREYQIRYETMITEKLAKNESITLFDYNPAETNKEILLNNIFGVDLNQESVEISKLALWLKTARKTERLQNLDKNIKCGNSLINDFAVAGEKAFNWNIEYKEIMNEGGFDVIVGNPPYVTTKYSKIGQSEKEYLLKNYETAYDKLDLYILFIEKAIKLCKTGGYISFITPWNFMKNIYSMKIRKYILEKCKIISFWKLPPNVFKDAIVDNVIFVLQKIEPDSNHEIRFIENDISDRYVLQNEFYNHDGYTINFPNDKKDEAILQKMQTGSIELGKIALNYIGIMTGGQENMIDNHPSFENSKPVLSGRDIDKWLYFDKGNYVNFDKSKIHSNDNEQVYLASKKILLRKTGSILIACIDEKQYFTIQSLYNIVLKTKDYLEEYIAILLNSRLLEYVYINFYITNPEVFPYLKRKHLDQFPIFKASKQQQQYFAEKATIMQNLSKELNEKCQKALEIFISKYSPISVSNTLKTFYRLGWNQLIIELEKQKVKLSLSNQEELQEWFNSKRTELLDLENKIKSLDSEINKDIYNLYGLTEEEIIIVEKSTET